MLINFPPISSSSPKPQRQSTRIISLSTTLLLLSIFIFFLFESSYAIYSNKKVIIEPSESNFAYDLVSDGFGFLSGGFASINISMMEMNKNQIDQSNLVLVGLPYYLWFILNSAKWDNEPSYTQYLCEVPSAIRVPINSMNSIHNNKIVVNDDNLNNLLISKTFNINTNSHYAFLILRCEPTFPTVSFELNLNIEMINPEGQHLSTQKQPFILVFFSLSVIYFLLFIYWIIISLKNYKFIYKLHLIIGLSIILQVISYLDIFIYYELINVNGIISDALDITLSIIGIFGDVSFLLIMLLVSIGYSILSSNEYRMRVKILFIGCFGFYITFRVLYAFCRDSTTCTVFVLAFRVIKFLITFGVIIAMNHTIEKLRIQSMEQQFSNDGSDVFIKMKKYKGFRLAFFIYLLGPLASLFVQYAIVTYTNYWILNAIEEVIILYLNYFIITTFYPQPYTISRTHQD
ncbi:hypothetical protein ABK040_005526 [Willaertia magna]